MGSPLHEEADTGVNSSRRSALSVACSSAGLSCLAEHGPQAELLDAVPLSVVDRARCWDAMMGVLADPRQLLLRHDEAAASLPEPASASVFDLRLAEAVSRLGVPGD